MNSQVARGGWRVVTGLRFRWAVSVLAVAFGLATYATAQETPTSKDDALDSLLQKLGGSSGRPGSKADRPSAPKTGDQGKKKPDDGKAKAKDSGATTSARSSGAAAAKSEKPSASKPGNSTTLTGKDQEVDELLQKLGETTETPAPDERPRGGAGTGEKAAGPGPSQRPDQRDRSRLSGKDKETDEHLEELTGRKRRKQQDSDERTGPAGQIIKEMRDIEQKLAKPDTGEGTREEQKQVVKKIETLIEEMKRSGQSSMRRMAMRKVRQQGRQPGQQPNSTEGANARGAPATKPLKPTTKHAIVGGKDIWGHLPPEMRALIDNVADELPLSTKQDLIDRYYVSVNQGKPRREEGP